MDRRKAFRSRPSEALGLSAEVAMFGEKPLGSTVRDLTGLGAEVKLLDPSTMLSVGQLVEVRFSCPDVLPLPVVSRVVHNGHTQESGVYGVQFLDYLGLQQLLPDQLREAFSIRAYPRTRFGPESPVEAHLCMIAPSNALNCNGVVRNLSPTGAYVFTPVKADLTAVNDIQVSFCLPHDETLLTFWSNTWRWRPTRKGIFLGLTFDENRAGTWDQRAQVVRFLEDRHPVEV